MLITMIILLAAINDAKQGKIPNWIIGCGIAVGGSKAIWQNGLEGLCLQMIEVLLIFLPLFTLYLLKILGAGDVKLISVIWLWLGTDQERLEVMKCIILVIGVMSFFAVVTKFMYGKRREKTSIRLGPAFLISWLIYLGGSNCV